MKRLLITLMILAVGCLVGPASAQAQATRQNRAERGQRAAGEPRSERMFVTRAGTDGQFEVQLGQLGQQKGSSQQVKDLAQMMVTDHQQVNQKLQQLAQSKNIPLSTTPETATTEKLQKLQGLSGTDFDRAWLEQVVKDHRRDVAAFERQSKRGADADVKSFATDTLPGLRHHLQMAEQALANMPKSGKQGTSTGTGMLHRHHGGASTGTNR